MCNNGLKNDLEIAVLHYVLQLDIQLTMTPEKKFCEIENRGECTIPKHAIICTEVPADQDKSYANSPHKPRRLNESELNCCFEEESRANSVDFCWLHQHC